MDLKTYAFKLDDSERDQFAGRCGTSWAHIRNIGYGQKTCGEKLAVAIERETGRQVTRRDLRPNDWWLIWPELVTDDYPIPQVKAA